MSRGNRSTGASPHGVITPDRFPESIVPRWFRTSVRRADPRSQVICASILDIGCGDEFGRQPPGQLRREPVPDEERIGPLTYLVGFAGAAQKRRLTIEQPRCGLLLRIGWVALTVLRFDSLGKDHIDDLVRHALRSELAAEGPLPARMGTVARADPLAGERLVIENAKVYEPLQRRLDEITSITSRPEPSPNLVRRSGAGFQKPQRRLRDSRNLLDLGVRLASLGR